MRTKLGATLGIFLCATATWANAPTDSQRPHLRQATAAIQPVQRPALATETAAREAAILASAAVPAPRKAVSRQEPAEAAGPDIRPQPRDGLFARWEIPADSLVEVSRQTTRIHFGAEGRPTPRPEHPLAGIELASATLLVPLTPDSPHPEARPAGFAKLFKRKDRYSAAGAVCEVNAIKGVAIPTVGRPSSGCGIENPVRITEMSGVRLSTPITVDCTTARALNTWVADALKPAVGRKGGGVEKVTVAASYACRTRNNIPGGKLSEHARGHAVDVSGFELENGTKVPLLGNWNSRQWGKTMKKLHKAACGPFGTVLGPNADRYHQDHFHFDTARYRSGSYCK
ncbi:extensin-like domain-containing protein [Tropicimonas aquimaris]|uniref:Extensin family protein n=1 Tax=Tropicimonas aquimaris TaxID=914152 RepID=A0ABW3IN76_9RHOB